MSVRRSAGALGVGLALVVLSAVPAWSEEPEPLAEGCSYVDAPAPDDGGTGAEPAPEEPGATEPAPEGSATEEPAPEPSATEEPPVEEPTEEPAPEPTAGDEPALGEGEVVVCLAAGQAGDGGFTGGSGGIETVSTPAQLPATGSGTGAAALVGLALVVTGSAVVASARTPRRA